MEKGTKAEPVPITPDLGVCGVPLEGAVLAAVRLGFLPGALRGIKVEEPLLDSDFDDVVHLVAGDSCLTFTPEELWLDLGGGPAGGLGTKGGERLLDPLLPAAESRTPEELRLDLGGGRGGRLTACERAVSPDVQGSGWSRTLDRDPAPAELLLNTGVVCSGSDRSVGDAGGDLRSDQS